MKMIKKQKDGKFSVNKKAVIAQLKKRLKMKDVAISALLPVSQREIEAEAAELTRYTADSLLNLSEE